MSSLEEEISQRRREIFADSYSMSIGEITNLYRDGEIDVHPEFQRIYRWDDLQKSRLIESILLGIPLPSIFVAQAESGAWDVVDGVQRLSTILQFQGVLKDDHGNLIPPVKLQGTKLLPSLAEKVWDDSNSSNSLTPAQRLDFKRAKLDLKIIKRESSSESKYDLFQRLNSYGAPATAQELRSCILISINAEFYGWLKDLALSEPFLETTSLNERLISEQYNYELAVRFLVFRQMKESTISAIGNLGEYLTEAISTMAQSATYDREAEGRRFRKTFELLAKSGGDDVFRRWNPARKRFQGAFLNTAFEVIALGLGCHIDSYTDATEVDALEKAKKFWSSSDYSSGFATGLRADTRMARSIPIGRNLFKK
ncbi:DUF262 domain-containing protein [Actinomadura sp. ATCC 31491]|uniref:DUF262 domain-containing protein n=1 Tax=Actinomadura luzonensis TaxID=2805427 RepID=A0ABT0GBD4_9ACTN|nr:DUF262 domain-containing protein [Actinomadura luzonensis]MCK2221907.1 DUF262 domain-containing protein [Actinomadura luzonensis]